MVGHFIRLKLRLLSNRLRRSEWQVVVGLVLVTIMALSVAAGTTLAMGLVEAFAAVWLPEVTVALYTLVAVAWLVGPLVAAAIDDTMDVRAFEALPLSSRQLGFGLLAAGAVGPGGVATFLALIGGTLAAFGSSPLGIVVSLVAGSAGSVMAVGMGRWATTWLSDLLRSRRSREVLALIFGSAVGLPAIAAATLGSGRVQAEALAGSLTRLRWTPPGAIGWSVVAWSSGRWVESVAFLLAGLVTTVAILWSYGMAVRRLQTRPIGAVSHRGSRSDVGLRPVIGGPAGAVISKELRYAWRDARLRSQFLGSGVAIVALVAVGGASAVFETPYAPFVGVVSAVLVLLPVVTNQFGVDSGGFWTYLVAAPDLGAVLRGKNVGWAIVAIPLGLATALLGALTAGRFAYVPAAVCTVVTASLLWTTVGNLVSIVGAFPLSESNMFGNTNVSGAVALWSLAGLLGVGVVQLPAALAIGAAIVLSGPGWTTVAALVSLVYALAVYVSTWRWVERIASERSHRLLDALDA